MFNVVTFNPTKLKTRLARSQTADNSEENVHGLIIYQYYKPVISLSQRAVWTHLRGIKTYKFNGILSPL